jgi:hypothetical protein
MMVFDNSKARPFFAQFYCIGDLAEEYPRLEDIFTAFAWADVGIRDTRPHNKTSLLGMLGRLDELSTRTIQQQRPDIGRQWASKLASVCKEISRHTQKYLEDSLWFDYPEVLAPDFEHLVCGAVVDEYDVLIHRLTCGNISEDAYDRAIHALIEAEYA